jgi:hypothetical protein
MMTILLEVIKPFVNGIIAIGHLKQWQPTRAGKTDKEYAVVFCYFSSYTHRRNIK